MAILSNLYVILILRVLHIGGGIMWVGSATLYLLLLIPVARSLHPAGQKFLQTLGPKFGAMMGLVTTVTVLSGALLYARFFAGGICFIWTTGAGFAFIVGAVAALGSYAMGVAVFGRMQERIAKLAAEIESAQSAPRERARSLTRQADGMMPRYISEVFTDSGATPLR